MTGFLIGFFTLVLIGISAFVILLVLMQKPSANAGMGASLGGGAAESAFGGETSNVLTRLTIYGAVAFFVIAFGLYLAQISRTKQPTLQGTLPIIQEEDPAVMPGFEQGSLTLMPGETPSDAQ